MAFGCRHLTLPALCCCHRLPHLEGIDANAVLVLEQALCRFCPQTLINLAQGSGSMVCIECRTDDAPADVAVGQLPLVHLIKLCLITISPDDHFDHPPSGA
ncbi:hypothetical protein AK973_3063 [Pseudomonas brassicacearum]|nr:hypothetical protein AK973_3063 [Pseudomonas brassicacearum]